MMMQRYAYPAARVLLAGIFPFSGANKLLDVPDTAADIAALGLPLVGLRSAKPTYRTAIDQGMMQA